MGGILGLGKMGTEGGRGAGEREMEDGNGRGSGHTPEAGRCAFEVDGWSQNPFAGEKCRVESFEVPNTSICPIESDCFVPITAVVSKIYIINQPTKNPLQSASHSASQTDICSINRSTKQPIIPPIIMPINQSIITSINESTNQGNQSYCQSSY